MIRRENIRLTVSNIIFHLEKSDYVMLSSYLNDAKKHYHSLPNGQKQFQEFEFSISEFLLSQLKDGEQHTTTEHIMNAIASSGSFLNKTAGTDHQPAKDAAPGEKRVSPSGKLMPSRHSSSSLVLGVLSILGLSF